MSFNRIPAELRAYPQWVVWRLEWREGDDKHEKKPTKVPYIPRPNGGKASVSNPADWGTFEQVCAAPMHVADVICEFGSPVVSYSGIGFVFSDNDPFTGIDLDDTHGDREAWDRQFKIFREFNSYSELSPSGEGLHIIVKGDVPGGGRRRAAIEVYSRERYFTMTGKVHHDAPIAERQELLTVLYEQMGGKPEEFQYADDKPATMADEDILVMARSAQNGEKFSALYDGDWHSLYGGDQSRADFALVDILGFYSRNKEQVRRMFMASQLGQRDKALREGRGGRLGYVENMIERSFDNQKPPLDIDGFLIKFRADAEAMLSGPTPAYVLGDGPASPTGKEHDAGPVSTVSGVAQASQPGDGLGSHGSLAPAIPVRFPPGLVGELAAFILSVSPRPVPQIALAASIGLLSGIMGRAYNISGAGLNQYVLMLARTGVGKDAISVGTSKIMAAVRQTVPASADFIGPGELVSSAGLIKWLADKPAVVSILGEFGVKMKEMASPNANAHLAGVERALLQLYSKSGRGNTFEAMAYSDKDKNTKQLESPSLTILAESVPERFYDLLDEAMIASGLLPRFMIYEYTGNREYMREGTEHIQPSFSLVQQMCDLCAQCLALAHNGNTHNVPMTNEAHNMFRDFDRWTTDEMNKDKSEVTSGLWNRAHLKAMKLAATIAVGINYINPVVTIDEAQYATDEIVKQTRRMLNKFADNEVGGATATNLEVRQRAEIYKHVGRYMTRSYEEGKTYGGTKEMHDQGVILDSHIQRRVMAAAAFRNDRMGPSIAIKRAIAYMVQSDELREMATTQMSERFGTKAKSYIVADSTPFLAAAKKDREREK